MRSRRDCCERCIIWRTWPCRLVNLERLHQRAVGSGTEEDGARGGAAREQAMIGYRPRPRPLQQEGKQPDSVIRADGKYIWSTHLQAIWIQEDEDEDVDSEGACGIADVDVVVEGLEQCTPSSLPFPVVAPQRSGAIPATNSQTPCGVVAARSCATRHQGTKACTSPTP